MLTKQQRTTITGKDVSLCCACVTFSTESAVTSHAPKDYLRSYLISTKNQKLQRNVLATQLKERVVQ